MAKVELKHLRKNGGFIWHWVRVSGPRRGEALCGAAVDRRKRRSYWIYTHVLGHQDCEKCEKLKQERDVDGQEKDQEEAAGVRSTDR